jgi:hypothetical protein
LAISVCLVGLLVLSSVVAVKPVLGLLQDVAVGTEYDAKLRDIRDSLEGGRNIGAVDARAERYTRSFKLFLENPVIGTLTFDDVGKHSAVLDRFAQYGFGIGLLFLALLAYMPIRMIRSSSVPIGLTIAFLVVAVGFPMLNNVFMSWGLILYVFSRGAVSVMQSSGVRNANTPKPRVMVGHA